jgi:predicted nucleic acid-binding protein
MTVIVDASVALKWVVDEVGSDAARRLIMEEVLAAPDLLFVECANSLWVKARRGQMTAMDARSAMLAIESAPVRAVATQLHASAAQAIAFELDQTAYDSLYLAVALAERATLVTADQAFAQAALAHPVYRGSLKLIGA